MLLFFAPSVVLSILDIVAVTLHAFQTERNRARALQRISTTNHVAAGVLGALLQVQADASPLALVVTGLVRAEAAQLKAKQPAADAQAGEGEAVQGKPKKRKCGVQNGEDLDQSGAAVRLPTEAQPLASLMELALKVLRTAEVSGAAAVQPVPSGRSAANGEVVAQAGQERKKRRRKADDASAAGKAASESFPSAYTAKQAGALDMTEVQVSGSDEAAKQLSMYLKQSRSSNTEALDLLQLQTLLLRAPAAAVAAKVPALARLVAQQPDQQQGGCLKVLVRACQAHSVPLMESNSAAQLDGGEESRDLERLLEASSASMLLLTANLLPGEQFLPHWRLWHTSAVHSRPIPSIAPSFHCSGCECPVMTTRSHNKH